MRWRRPLDVWERLPGGIRRYRAIVLFSVLYFAALLVPTFIVNSTVDQDFVRTGRRPPLRAAVRRVARPLPQLHAIVMVACCGVLIGYYVSVRSSLKRNGSTLDDYDMQRVFAAPTANRRFWSRPAVAAVLLPEGARPGARTQQMSPDEIARALDELPQRVAESERELAARARSAAEKAREALLALDAELQALEREYDSAEAKRLEEKLVAIGEPRPDEPAERGRMRELIGQQAALLRGVASRLESGRRERERRLGQLQALWLQADALRSPDSARNPGISRVCTRCSRSWRAARGATPRHSTAEAA